MQAIYTVCTSFEKWTNYLSTSKQTKPNCPFLPATSHIVSWRVQTGAYARTFLELTWPFMQNVASSPITQFGRRCSFLLHRFVKHLAKFSRLCMKIMHVVTNYAVRPCSMGVVANPIKSVKNLKLVPVGCSASRFLNNSIFSTDLPVLCLPSPVTI